MAMTSSFDMPIFMEEGGVVLKESGSRALKGGA